MLLGILRWYFLPAKTGIPVIATMCTVVVEPIICYGYLEICMYI